MKCNICHEEFDCGNLSEVAEHEHTGLELPPISGVPIRKTFDETQSANVSEISYSYSWKTMDVIYKNGNCYRYQDVPSDVFNAAFSASHIGQFLCDHIKGQYRYWHVNGD